MENLLVLDTHYGFVRYLYNEVFKKKKNQINDLQNQIMFLSCLNKYMLCRTGKFSQLYAMYSSLNISEIINYYEDRRAKINMNINEWINFSKIIPSPKILPKTVDGPYIIDDVSLHRYTHFWTKTHKINSNILATPFFCLTGLDHLYYEMINWKGLCEQQKIKMEVNVKHIFHDTFYMIEFSEIYQKDVRFLIWLDDVDIDTELYVIDNETDDDEDENYTHSGGSETSYGPKNISLLKRLYIACNDNVLFYKMFNLDNFDPIQNVINIFVNNLSQNFLPTFDGNGPKNFKTSILDLTNTGSDYDGILDFNQISRFGFNPEKTDQIYEIENLSQLNITTIRTPYFLIFQEQFNVTSPPTVAYMNTKLQEFLYFMSAGIIDKKIFLRMYIMPNTVESYPTAIRKQLSVIYMQKYKKFCLNRQNIDFNPTFYDNVYVFAARNLLCTVKSIKHLVRDTITSPTLLPPCVMLLETNKEDILWFRLTQNILYLRRLQALCFLKDFTLQELTNTKSPTDSDMKTIRVLPENKIRAELNTIFSHTGINKFETNSILVYEGIDLKCIRINRDLNFELYYFAHNIKEERREDIKFKLFFEKFMHSTETKRQLGDKIYMIFMHLLNLYVNDVIL